nr:MAG TPA: hypothetical protein [Caudoviricetes sp.]
MNTSSAKVTFKVRGKLMQQEFMNFASERVQDMVKLGGNDFVYCDTDSCKMLNYEKYLDAFEKA